MRFVIALLVLSCVIIFHELGHFLAAKASHVKVNEFAFGMGPKILSFKKGDTVYAWRLFPIGGMCAMQGEDDEDDSEGSFQKAKVWQKILIVAAGPLFNFLLALIIAFIVIIAIGADPARVTEVEKGSPAAEAGLQSGDIITSFNGGGVSNSRELYMYILLDGVPTDEINLTYERDGSIHNVSYVPDFDERYLIGINYIDSEDEDSEGIKISEISKGYPAAQSGLASGDIITYINGQKITDSSQYKEYMAEHPFDGSPVNITYERDGVENTVTLTPKVTRQAKGGFSFNMAREKQGLLSTVGYSFGELKYWINTTIKSIGSLFTGRFKITDLSGPVGVVSTIGNVYKEAADEGGAFEALMTLLNMVILLSANLGVMNLLPLPALDGGRLIFLFVEAIRRKPCNQRIEGVIHFIGIVALLGLAAFIAVNDIIKII